MENIISIKYKQDLEIREVAMKLLEFFDTEDFHIGELDYNYEKGYYYFEGADKAAERLEGLLEKLGTLLKKEEADDKRRDNQKG